MEENRNKKPWAGLGPKYIVARRSVIKVALLLEKKAVPEKCSLLLGYENHKGKNSSKNISICSNAPNFRLVINSLFVAPMWKPPGQRSIMCAPYDHFLRLVSPWAPFNLLKVPPETTCFRNVSNPSSVAQIWKPMGQRSMFAFLRTTCF